MATEKEPSRLATTAVEARRNVEASKTLINRIYKFIKEASVEGEHTIIYETEAVEERILKVAAAELTAAGFDVEYAHKGEQDEIEVDGTHCFDSEYGIAKVSW